MSSEVFYPLDLLIIFTNKNYQVCWGGCRMPREQTTYIFKRKLKSLMQRDAFFPTALSSPVPKPSPADGSVSSLSGALWLLLQVPRPWKAPGS